VHGLPVELPREADIEANATFSRRQRRYADERKSFGRRNLFGARVSM
jgi:hypothetical protein